MPLRRLVLFDIDGTLLHTRGAGQRAFRRALRRHLGTQTPSVPVDYAGRTDLSILAETVRRAGRTWPLPGDLARRILTDYVAFLEEELDRAGGEGPYPGIPHLLEALQAIPGVGLGVLTGNVRGAARAKLRHFGLERYFPVGAFGDACEERWRLVDLALEAARRHWGDALPADRVWLVGDTPRDVEAARRAGAHVLAVATGPYPMEELQEAGADAVLPTLATPEALRLLEPPRETQPPSSS
jgi:phosphoglycolate phosphatase-like HAD superfamily hydrolase